MPHAVVLIFTNQHGDFLLQQRDERALKHPSSWSFFGGAMDPHEAPEAAAIREAQEELQYQLSHPVLMQTVHIPGDGIKYFFLEKYDAAQTYVLREGRDAQWFSSDEALKLPLPPHHKDALLALRLL